MRKLRILNGIGMFLAAAALLQGADAPSLDRRQLKIPVTKGVVVNNPFGDVRLRKGSPEGIMEVYVVFQQLREDGTLLETKLNKSGDLLEVVWAEKESAPARPAPADDRSRADLVIRVPLDISIKIQTKSGLIEAKGVQAKLDLKSVSGDIRFNEIKGTLHAESRSGTIEGVLTDKTASERQEFRTRTGAITVRIPPGEKHSVLLQSSGTFTTDFSLEIEHHDGEEPNKFGTLRINGGGPEILLTSKRGNLSILRLPTVRKTTIVGSEAEKTQESH